MRRMKGVAQTETLAVWYLEESGGNRAEYLVNLGVGQRIGQAFFNALSGNDQEKLRGTAYDPFYGGQVETYEAIDYLTR